MSNNKKVTKAKVEEAAKEVPKVEAPVEVQENILEQMAAFKSRMDDLEKENRLLNEQMKLKEQVGKDPLAYANGVESKPIEAPNVIPSYSARLLRMMEEDEKMVEGKFEFKEITNPKEAKGSTVTFHYRKYPGRPVVTYTLRHNEVRQIPLGVANHINGELGGCKYAIHKHVMDQNGNPVIDNAGEEVHRMGFHSTKFL